MPSSCAALKTIGRPLRRVAEADLVLGGEEFQQAVAAHYAWLASQPNATTGRERYLGLADTYVADDRFAAICGRPQYGRRRTDGRAPPRRIPAVSGPGPVEQRVHPPLWNLA